MTGDATIAHGYLVEPRVQSQGREGIETGKLDWREVRVPDVPGDEDEFTPLPQ